MNAAPAHFFVPRVSPVRFLFFLLSAALVVYGCSGSDEAREPARRSPPRDQGAIILPRPLDLPPWPGLFSRAAARNQATSPGQVYVELEAMESEIEVAAGRTVRMWTYNGQLPGPRIEAHVGDLVQIRFKNSLPESTTIHWHGLRVPADMDGTHVSREPIEPGEEFTYEFVVKDAGTFWYHPHLRGAEQVERGLYGAFVVRGDDEPNVSSERTVVLDDLLIGKDWQIAPFDPRNNMIGRQGNVLLANGRAHPIAEVSAGGLHRFRFVNAANARYFRLALPGYRITQIGTDGGFLERPLDVSEVLLVPGERADVVVQSTDTTDENVDWQTLSYDRGHGTGALPDAPLIRLVQTDYEVDARNGGLPEAFQAIPELGPAEVARELTLSEGLEGSAELAGGHASTMDASDEAGHGSAPSDESDDSGGRLELKFAINGRVYPAGEPMAAVLGTVENWTVTNESEMDHPFHLHGFRFQTISIDGEEPAIRAWRDTVNVAAKQTIELRLQLEDHPGSWLFHCHIQEHADNGMMGELRVEPND